MSKWGGKYVIGLTGNIGTGKSVVRRMLEHLGAYGIDADALAHRAIAKGAPAYRPVVKAFGEWVLGADGEIDRAKLGSLVFSNPTALKELEKIVHPIVNQAVEYMARRAKQPVVVVEAIKLLETDLSGACDSIWVSYASPQQQLDRLMRNRKMSAAQAQRRIEAQSPQKEKIQAADVVIKNVRSFEDTWKQVVRAWKRTLPDSIKEPAKTAPRKKASAGEVQVLRGKPKHADQIAALINEQQKSEKELQRGDIMAAFGEKAFLLLKVGGELKGLIGWQVENLVARTVDIILAPELEVDKMLPSLIQEMEQASKDLQCEASLVFTMPELSKLDALWKELGYRIVSPEKLGVMAWQEAAKESMKPGTTMLFKQLRKDRVLRPI